MSVQEHASIPKLELVSQVVISTIRIAVISGFGIYLARKGVLKEKDIKGLSNLSEHILLPALIFTNFIHALDLTDLGFWLPCAVVTVLTIFCGGFLGYLLNKFFLQSKVFEHIIVFACALSHTTSFQLLFLNSFSHLFKQIPGQEMYANDPNPFKKDAVQRGISYVMIVAVVNNLMRWSVGTKYIRLAKQSYDQVMVENGFAVEANDDEELKAKPVHKSFLNAPVGSALLAIIICCIPPVRNYLNNGSNFASQVFIFPLEVCGKALYSVTIIILGSSLYLAYQKDTFNQFSISKAALVSITVLRLILFPILGAITLWGFWIVGIIKDPLCIFVLFITYGMPTAINILVQATQIGNIVGEVSKILMVGYLSATITLPCLLYLYFVALLP